MSDHGRHKPQTQVIEKGYNPHLSEGAAIPPVFRTSTFVFRDAMQGKRAFELAYHLRAPEPGESQALIYTRVNNPNCEMVEDRVVAWDRAEAAALFSSGMGAISAVCLTFLRPGDTVVFADPVYGGTEFLFRHVLPGFGIRTVPFPAGSGRDAIAELVRSEPAVRVVYLETPANPTIVLTDIEAARAATDDAGENRPLLIVDNTFMGPIFCQPLRFGADLVLYSATKFIGGHSDLVAGLALGSRDLISRVKVTRTVFGSNSDPDTAWLILRSLGTLQLRMEKQQENARSVVDFLRGHAKVRRVAYPGAPDLGAAQREVFERQCTGSGSLVSFAIDGGEAEAFAVLDRVRVCRLAVSLGGIETLIEHPATMTHADMSEAEKTAAGIGADLIRISVGLEDPEDIIADLRQALDPLP
ncbi:MAG: aminotransferase class I/II-fold pyridoxal phosphate-dependent enzyme [Acidobacteriota bacterium]